MTDEQLQQRMHQEHLMPFYFSILIMMAGMIYGICAAANWVIALIVKPDFKFHWSDVGMAGLCVAGWLLWLFFHCVAVSEHNKTCYYCKKEGE